MNCLHVDPVYRSGLMQIRHHPTSPRLQKLRSETVNQWPLTKWAIEHKGLRSNKNSLSAGRILFCVVPQEAFICDLLVMISVAFLVSRLQDTALKKPREVFRLPADLTACDNRLCASMHFASSAWATLSDGTGRLYLIRTGKRGEGACEKWEVSLENITSFPWRRSLRWMFEGVPLLSLAA